MPKIVRTIFDSGSVNLSTSVQPQAEKIIPNHGDIKGFNITITATAAGTLTTAHKLAYCIDSIDLLDKNSQPILSKIRGQDLALYYFETQGGKAVTETDVASGSNTDVYLIPLRVDSSMQAAKLTVNLAAYSNMAASGATAGTARVIIAAVYDDDANDKRTQRLFRIQKSLVSGTNAFAPDIVKARNVKHVWFTVGTESNLTDVTFSRDGSLELQNVSVNQFKAFDNASISGHQTAIFELGQSSFMWEPKTVLDFTGAGSDTVQLFFLTEE